VGLVKLGYALLPKPDLVVLLDAPPELLHNRKQELPLPELQRQRLAFQQLVQALPHAAVIDASRPPEEVARNIARAVLERSAQRYSEFSEPKDRSGYLSHGLSALCWGEFLFLP
jgi:thymidylate kinase